jgi:hypothetical protein
MSEPVTRAAQWALIVLIAGFIGYIGRYLAMIIIKRIRKEAPEKTGTVVAKESEKARKLDYKLEKKRLKLEEKKMKKKRD